MVATCPGCYDFNQKGLGEKLDRALEIIPVVTFGKRIGETSIRPFFWLNLEQPQHYNKKKDL